MRFQVVLRPGKGPIKHYVVVTRFLLFHTDRVLFGMVMKKSTGIFRRTAIFLQRKTTGFVVLTTSKRFLTRGLKAHDNIFALETDP